MSFEQAIGNEAQVAKTQGADDKELCRDFKKGDCRRGERCIYYHPKLDVCRDYQFRECTRNDCRFVHVTKAEEEKFNGSGLLPPHVQNGPVPAAPIGGYTSVLGKRGFGAISVGQQLPLPMHKLESQGEVCRDFDKGDCRRGQRCKFYHPKLVICRDFQKGKCERENCRFLHMTQDEEKTYEGNGIVPDHVDKEKVKKNRVIEAPSDNTGERYGKRNQGVYPMAKGFPIMSLDVALQENSALKIKLTEMQQQVADLRRMNDTLYEQNNNYRNHQNY